MSLRYHERLRMMRPFHVKAIEFAYCCIGWLILLAFDCLLFAIGHKWSDVRADSRRIWR